MRIVGGKFRGRGSIYLSDELTRPTTDRVRENIFNVIGAKIKGARVLDLFSGSGAMAAESLSRGAKSVVACDNRREMVEIIRKNVAKLGEIDAIFGDFRAVLAQIESTFDVVFIDPPYDSGFAQVAISLLQKYELLAKGAVVVVEMDKNSPELSQFGQVRKYGRAFVYFLEFNT